MQGAHDDLRVVTVRQVVGNGLTAGKGLDDQHSVADAFGCRQVDGCLQPVGSGYFVVHNY